jgi:hypothetical protein
MLDPMQGVRTGATAGEDPMGTGRPDVTPDPTQGAVAVEPPYEDPSQRSEPEASPAIPTHDEISVRAYFIYLETPESDDVRNWLRAERELTPA